MDESPKSPNILVRLGKLVADFKAILLLLGGLTAGGAGMRAWGDAGVTKAESTSIADSVVDKKLAPIVANQKRQDTALMRIFFRQDIQMTDAQKLRADSLMRAALKNINYGGNP